MKDTVIFGAGFMGIEILKAIGKDEIYCFIDNDVRKQGTYIEDIKIVSLKQYLDEDIKKNIIISPGRLLAMEIQKQLENAGITDYRVWQKQLFEDLDYIDWGTETLNENSWEENCVTYNLKESVQNFVNTYGDDVPLFSEIEIETVNQCNGGCSFCPVNNKSDTREKKIMDENLFKKIIDELSGLKYRRRIALFSNNEPFIDTRMVELHKYARERLPYAQFHLFTNGTLLTLDLFNDIIEYLDELVIDNYNVNLELIPTVAKIKQYIDEKDDTSLRKKVKILVRNPNEILSSRGGDAPNKKCMENVDNDTCALPFCQMIVRPSGEVSLCCNDPLGKVTLGDLRKESLTEVWYGEKYNNIRELLKAGRKNIAKCKACDTFMII